VTSTGISLRDPVPDSVVGSAIHGHEDIGAQATLPLVCEQQLLDVRSQQDRTILHGSQR
jgi:hypothetical protein